MKRQAYFEYQKSRVLSRLWNIKLGRASLIHLKRLKREWLKNTPYLKFVYLGTFLFYIVCFLVSCQNSQKPNSAPIKRKIENLLNRFEVENAFWNSSKKIRTHGDSLYVLTHSFQNPDLKAQSQIYVYDLKSRRKKNDIYSPQLKSPQVLMDFDFTSQGQLVQLVSTEVENSDFEELPFRELSIYIDQEKVFTFHDPKIDEAIGYDEYGRPVKYPPFDKSRTLFLVYSPFTEFARIFIHKDILYLSAVGTFGYKVFALNLNGSEIQQVEILPKSPYNQVIFDSSASHLGVIQDQILSVMTISKSDLPIYNKHFLQDMKWMGKNHQVLFQMISMKSPERKVAIVSANDNFFTNGFSFNENQVAIYGNSGVIGNRNAVIVNLDYNLKILYNLEYTIEKESDILSAEFRGNQLIVGGETSFLQVSTGSLTEFGDSFLSFISPKGQIINSYVFGTTRRDRITSIHSIQGDIYLAGNEDGPITHTGDADKSQNYQNWFLGKWKE